MSLIKCSECGKEISDKATTCPHCGAPVEKSETVVETPKAKAWYDVARYESRIRFFRSYQFTFSISGNYYVLYNV